MNLLNTKWFWESDSMDSKVKSTFLINLLYKLGFSTFWYSRTPKSKLYPNAYSQIKIVPLCKPPNQNFTPMHTTKLKLPPYAYPQIRLVFPLRTPQLKFYPTKLHLSGVFYFAYPCGRLMYPLWPLHVPPGWEPLLSYTLPATLILIHKASNPNRFQAFQIRNMAKTTKHWTLKGELLKLHCSSNIDLDFKTF